jgi:hypothetical protein
MIRAEVKNSIKERFGCRVQDLAPGHQKALFFLNVLRATGDLSLQKPRTMFHCSELPPISIEEYYLVIAQVTNLSEEQTSAIALLLERVCSKSHIWGLDLSVNPYTIHK